MSRNTILIPPIRPEPPITLKQAELLKAKKEQLERKRQAIVEGLPHLYGFKWYAWARAFVNSTNKMNLLVAGNQLSKSSTQIRKVIRWATDRKLWPKLWQHQPRIFWYLYPTRDVATVEFENKWIPEFMPRGPFKDDPIYGWDAVYDKKQIMEIRFKSGITVFFKTYAQDAKNLQTTTLDAIFTDEELPEDLYPELQARLIASDGYFHMVFTATLNQMLWHQAMEGKGEAEAFPQAFKQQISMYDCQFYDDGSPSQWNLERIKRVEASCSSEKEVQRRIHGRFVTEDGLKYPQFNPTLHFIAPRVIPSNWDIYGAIDKGSGRKTKKNNHYSAIVFIAVNPERTLGYVCKGWRGDGIEATSQDILDQFKMMRPRHCALQIFPHDAKDFGIIAQRQGESFIAADKSHARGEDVLNTLFKANMLLIFEHPELRKLGTELLTLMKATIKDNAKDDIADALRYCSVAIPWDWNHAARIIADAEINGSETGTGEAEERPLTDQECIEEEIRARRGEPSRFGRAKESRTIEEEFDDECQEWNEAYGS